MTTPPPMSEKSTTVRKKAPAWLRAGFATGSWLAPALTLRYATRLFATPHAGMRRRAQNADRGDARTDTVACGDARLATYVWGDPARQPTVLFVHGWSSYGLRCLPWVRPLREAGYAVVAFDQPAHGRSGGDEASLPHFVEATLAVAAQHASLAAVVGHSMGGMAAAVALSRGIRADRAVLIAPAADMRAAGQRFGRQVALQDRLVTRMFERFETRLGVRLADLTPQALAPALGIPALVVHDRADDEVPWEEGERYARYWPGARLLTVTGAGHHRIAAAPDTIEATLRFLRGGSPGVRVVSSLALPYGVA